MPSEDWFRPFVEHLVCTSKTKGCSTTFKCYPTPCKTKKKTNTEEVFVWRGTHKLLFTRKFGEKVKWERHVGEEEKNKKQ
jgi:hypothetical protein